MELKLINFDKVYSILLNHESSDYVVGQVDFENSRNGNVKVIYPILIRDIFAYDLSENRANGFTNVRKLNSYGKENYTFINYNNILSIEKANLLCKIIYFSFIYNNTKEQNIFIKREDLSEEDLETICIRRKENIIEKLNKLLKLN